MAEQLGRSDQPKIDGCCTFNLDWEHVHEHILGKKVSKVRDTEPSSQPESMYYSQPNAEYFDALNEEENIEMAQSGQSAAPWTIKRMHTHTHMSTRKRKSPT